ncbi:uncharacterized protein LOC110467127 [Mizuhopecten yessoensis]|uniref:Uncharacterized protein n=1 Tax=Mizuhopecten yessoensis TaxID=6573 RepID=A0A210PMK4_MIZYE|nr:uncharacterized protein LOC110467127 [Mizuhopecten yessoensis]OWF37704.1 hypothetical protein KP79_PYT21362 [Mizuhopecten yessoensis]
MATSQMNSLPEEEHVSDQFLECSICGNPLFVDDVRGPRYESCANPTCKECMTRQLLQSCDSHISGPGSEVHHSDETVVTHEVYINNHDYPLASEMAPREDSTMQPSQEIDNSMQGPVRTINETCQLIWKLWTFSQDLVTTLAPLFLLMMLVTICVYIPSFPAYTILPSEEVEPVNMICRHRTKEEVYQNMETSKKQEHRTVCTFNVFHYNLLSRNRTYFVLDINIDIAKTYHDGRVGKLFTIKMFYLNKEHKTHHKQRSMYLSVSRCKTKYDEIAICLEDVSYKKETLLTQKLISTVVMEQNKRVSFLFLVDNEKKIMEIFTPVVLWKDVVFLEHYYESKTLSVWISLADSKNDKYVTARIRSGADVAIGDLPNPAIVTNYQIVHGVLTYPFRCLYAYLWNTFLPLPIPNENNEKETLHP